MIHASQNYCSIARMRNTQTQISIIIITLIEYPFPMGLSHLLLRALFISTAWNLIQADARQIPLHNNFNFSKEELTRISWDFFQKPNQDSTSQLVFNTANSLLQRWPNTRYRNGQANVFLLLIHIYNPTKKTQDIPSYPERFPSALFFTTVPTKKKFLTHQSGLPQTLTILTSFVMPRRKIRNAGISHWLLLAHLRFYTSMEVVRQSFSEGRWTVRIS